MHGALFICLPNPSMPNPRPHPYLWTPKTYHARVPILVCMPCVILAFLLVILWCMLF
jgi:hypothetical protein